MLKRIFMEIARTLRPSGTLILTYHSTNFLGWAAVGLALRQAGFRVIALATGHSEHEMDHAIRRSLTCASDLVLDGDRHTTQTGVPDTVNRPRPSRVLGSASTHWQGPLRRSGRPKSAESTA